MDFLRGVLCGEKKLFRLNQVNIINHLPRYPEICLKEIWDRARQDAAIRPYFSDKALQSSRPPNRTFLFTVNKQAVSTLYPEFFKVFMAKVKEERRKRLNIQEDVVLTDELVRNIATFAGVMLSEESIKEARNGTRAAQSPHKDKEGLPKETGSEGPAELSNSDSEMIPSC